MTRHIIKIIIICLLLVLPMAAPGQTNLPKYESDGWWSTLYRGGMIRTKEEGRRTGKYYLNLPDGLSGWFNGNYVDGFFYGPGLTLGKVNEDCSRYEIDADVKYSTERQAFMGRFSVRYIFAPEYQGNVSLFAQRYTDDFDPEPMMSASLSSTASALFGWNSYKLYLKSALGAKGTIALLDDLQLTSAVWWEGRERMKNNRKRNAFRVVGEDNYPRMRGYDPAEAENCALTNWHLDQLVRLDLQLSYSLGRWILVKDDLHSSCICKAPEFTIKMRTAYNGNWDDCADYGTLQQEAGEDKVIGWKYGVRYLSLELGVSQELEQEHQRLRYMGSAGCFVVRNNIGLADMRHFDATHYLWQETNSLTWFSLLTNYELSTSRHWAELHGEYLRKHNSFFAQYAQIHYLTVAKHCPHYELSYGWQLPQDLRFGLSAGWDGATFDGLGFNLILPLKQ